MSSYAARDETRTMMPPHHDAMWAGWNAGLRGADPRECPYEKMTVEWREWLSWHRFAVELSLEYEEWLKSRDEISISKASE